MWFTDGSKTKNGTRADVYRIRIHGRLLHSNGEAPCSVLSKDNCYIGILPRESWARFDDDWKWHLIQSPMRRSPPPYCLSLPSSDLWKCVSYSCCTLYNTFYFTFLNPFLNFFLVASDLLKKWLVTMGRIQVKKLKTNGKLVSSVQFLESLINVGTEVL